MKKSQAWSMDIMIAMVIFIGVIFVFYNILSSNEDNKIRELKDDALIVAENIDLTKNPSQIEELLGEDYSELKKKLRVKNEFCIFLENEEGNVIYITDPDDDTKTYPGIGSGKVKISGYGCNPQCNDGIDNDGDGKCDLDSSTCTDGSSPGDDQCLSTLDNDESS